MSRLQIYPKNVLIALTGLTCLTLIFAYGFQVMWNLKPCVLCVYQRYVSGIIVCLGAVSWFRSPTLHWYAVCTCLCLLMLNGGIAVFQVLVEYHIVPPPGACAAGVLAAGSVEEMRRALLNTAPVSCDQVQWSFLGLSMATYHGLYCFINTGFLGYFLRQWRRSGV